LVKKGASRGGEGKGKGGIGTEKNEKKTDKKRRMRGAVKAIQENLGQNCSLLKIRQEGGFRATM